MKTRGGEFPPGEMIDSATTLGATTPARTHNTLMAAIRRAIICIRRERRRIDRPKNNEGLPSLSLAAGRSMLISPTTSQMWYASSFQRARAVTVKHLTLGIQNKLTRLKALTEDYSRCPAQTSKDSYSNMEKQR